MPSPPLPSSPMSTQTLTKRQHGRRSHRYGMFRVKLRGHQPIHPLRTTRRRNPSLSSTIQQARIIAEAVAVKAKRATDQVVTVTITSTQAGASKVRLDLWVSRVQAERRVQTRSALLAAFSSGYLIYGIGDGVAQLGILHLDDFPPSFLLTYFLPSTASFGIPHTAGGRSFFLQSWVALDIGVCESTLARRLDWHNPLQKRRAGRSEVFLLCLDA